MKCFKDSPQPARRGDGMRFGFLGERGQIGHSRRRTDNPLVVLRSGLDPFRYHVGSRLKLEDIESLELFLPAEQHAKMWPIEFIGRAGQEVTTPFLNVDELMRCEMHCVHKRDNIGFTCHGDGSSNVVERSERIGGCTNRHHSCLGMLQASIQVIPVKFAGFGDHSHLKNRDAALAFKCPPGIDVGMMIQLCATIASSEPSRRPSALAR